MTATETTFRELLRNVTYAPQGSPEQNEALDAAWEALSDERRASEPSGSESRDELFWRMS